MSSASSPQGQGRYATADDASTTTNEGGRAPASDKAIQGLRQITAGDHDFPSGECAICLQDFDFGAAEEKDTLQLRALPCSHAFHHHCISRWLRCNAVCPLCRHQLPTEEDDYVDENMWFVSSPREFQVTLNHPAYLDDVSTEYTRYVEELIRGVMNEVYNDYRVQWRGRQRT